MYSENKNYVDKILNSASLTGKENSIVELEILLRGSFKCRLSMKGLNKLSSLPKSTINKVTGLFQQQSSILEQDILRSKKDLWEFYQYVRRNKSIDKEYYNGKKHTSPDLDSNIKYVLNFVENVLQNFKDANIKELRINPEKLGTIEKVELELNDLRSEYQEGNVFRKKFQEHRASIAKIIDMAHHINEPKNSGLVPKIRKIWKNFIQKGFTQKDQRRDNKETEDDDPKKPNIIEYQVNNR